jgi:CRP/FNR family transcriptional regulator/CRP/FNR family cyclic AMP-dependent transcriptional regulator
VIYSTQDRELIKKYIKNVVLFNTVGEDHLEQVIADFSLINATKNETILFQEDTGKDLYIILKGKVKVTLMSDEGEEYILSDLDEGDYFGEMSLIDSRPRCATVVAVEDSTFAVLKRERLVDAIKQNPL